MQPINCFICYENKTCFITCESCSNEICIQCYSHCFKCPFCRNDYDKPQPVISSFDSNLKMVILVFTLYISSIIAVNLMFSSPYMITIILQQMFIIIFFYLYVLGMVYLLCLFMSWMVAVLDRRFNIFRMVFMQELQS